MKPDALAHLADALMEDIVATPPHRLAIEELADSRRSRELIFRFDDILAEADAMAEARPVTVRATAIWNLTDALCADIATQPPAIPHDAADDGAAGQALADAFDDILNPDANLAAAGLTLPRRAGSLLHSVAYAKAAYIKSVLVKLLDQLAAPLHSRAAAGAFATVVIAAVVTVAVHEYGTPARQPERIAQAYVEPPRDAVAAAAGVLAGKPGSKEDIESPREIGLAAMATRDAVIPALQPPVPPGDAGGRQIAAAAASTAYPSVPAPGRFLASRAPVPRAAPAVPPAPSTGRAAADDDALAAVPTQLVAPMAVSKAQAPAAVPARTRQDAHGPLVARSEAQYDLGRMYLDGEGAARDPVRGTQWLYQAAAKGQYEAQAMLGALLFKGLGTVVPRDGATGLTWLRIARDAAPQGAGGIEAAYNAAWQQATEEERRAALVLQEKWRNGRGSPPSAGGNRPPR